MRSRKISGVASSISRQGSLSSSIMFPPLQIRARFRAACGRGFPCGVGISSAKRSPHSISVTASRSKRSSRPNDSTARGSSKRQRSTTPFRISCGTRGHERLAHNPLDCTTLLDADQRRRRSVPLPGSLVLVPDFSRREVISNQAGDSSVLRDLSMTPLSLHESASSLIWRHGRARYAHRKPPSIVAEPPAGPIRSNVEARLPVGSDGTISPSGDYLRGIALRGTRLPMLWCLQWDLLPVEIRCTSQAQSIRS